MNVVRSCCLTWWVVVCVSKKCRYQPSVWTRYDRHYRISAPQRDHSTPPRRRHDPAVDGRGSRLVRSQSADGPGDRPAAAPPHGRRRGSRRARAGACTTAAPPVSTWTTSIADDTRRVAISRCPQPRTTAPLSATGSNSAVTTRRTQITAAAVRHARHRPPRWRLRRRGTADTSAEPRLAVPRHRHRHHHAAATMVSRPRSVGRRRLRLGRLAAVDGRCVRATVCAAVSAAWSHHRCRCPTLSATTSCTNERPSHSNSAD